MAKGLLSFCNGCGNDKGWCNGRSEQDKSDGNLLPVSYTHLDVYKRQVYNCINHYSIILAEAHYSKRQQKRCKAFDNIRIDNDSVRKKQGDRTHDIRQIVGQQGFCIGGRCIQPATDQTGGIASK